MAVQMPVAVVVAVAGLRMGGGVLGGGMYLLLIPPTYIMCRGRQEDAV